MSVFSWVLTPCRLVYCFLFRAKVAMLGNGRTYIGFRGREDRGHWPIPSPFPSTKSYINPSTYQHLLISPEDGGIIFLLNVGIHLPVFTSSKSRRQHYQL
jgi:hypothetical protein